MTSILVSSDENELCNVVSKQVAGALGYDLVGVELLDEIAKQHDLKLVSLQRVLDPSARKTSARTRALLLARIQAAALERLLDDNVVCGGLAAHLYVKGISHVLTIRVLSNRRPSLIASGLEPAPRLAALLKREKARRSKWSMESFGIDEEDPSIYDILLSMGSIEQDKVVDVIKDMAAYRKFQSMTYSTRCLRNLALAARLRVALLPKHPDIRVKVDGDTAIVHVKCSKRSRHTTAATIKETAASVNDIAVVEVHPVGTSRELQRVDLEATTN